MRPRSERAACAAALPALALLAAACGTLASPSTGDVDLPQSFVGPLSALNTDQRPSRSQALITTGESGINLDEPSVVRIAGHRVAFMSYFATPETSTIGRASERADQPLSLQFESATRLLSPERPWEGAAISSPSVVALDDSNLVMAYAAAGGIGVARSADGGMTWTRADGPVLAPDRSNGEADTVREPELARTPSGGWYMLYESGGELFAATAADPGGPWTRAPGPVGSAVLGPVADPTADAGADGGVAGFESAALGDPALTVLTTAAGRTQYVLYYTAYGSQANSVIGAAGSFDGAAYSRLSRAAYTDRSQAVRAGSVEVVDERTILVWISTGSNGRRVISALIGPPMSRGSSIN